MKVSQFNYKQGKGTATIFKPEDGEEMAIIEIIAELIESGEGVLSRQSFTFNEDGSMAIDMLKRIKKVKAPVTPVSQEEPAPKPRKRSTKSE